MVKNDLDQAVHDVLKILHKFNQEWGLTAGFVYSTHEGILQFLGSQAIRDVVLEHQEDILRHPAFSHQTCEDDPDFILEEATNQVRVNLKR